VDGSGLGMDDGDGRARRGGRGHQVPALRQAGAGTASASRSFAGTVGRDEGAAALRAGAGGHVCARDGRP
jgi:hypothetical protein